MAEEKPDTPAGARRRRERLEWLYRRLLDRYGPQHWWPGDGPFEVMIGAILTQSAAWSNVERGIAALKQHGAMAPQPLRLMPRDELAQLIYSCGYYNAKAVKIKALVTWLGDRCGDDLERLFAQDATALRRELLDVHGIGEETADSIILYAAGKPVFVIDAYTRRILPRLGLKPDKEDYAGFQRLFMEHLPHSAPMFNEYHALLVRHGKDVCRKAPRCPECCLAAECEHARSRPQM